jgi:MFS family permease
MISKSQHGLKFFFLNLGHFLDHFFVLIFATSAALMLTLEWNIDYAALIPYATPGFIAFGLFSIPAGWLADRWSRDGMMVIFFIGIGASSVFAGFANNPLQISISLVLVGIFAAIYHPVGLAMVVEDRRNTGIPIAINGVFGNLGVACAALVTGLLIDIWGWRSAFVIPGLLSVFTGILYWWFFLSTTSFDSPDQKTKDSIKGIGTSSELIGKNVVWVFSIILVTTAIGGFIFQSTTFSLPKILNERMPELAGTATMVGWYAFLVFSFAALAQLVVGYLVDHYSIRTVFSFIAILQTIFFAIMISMVGFSALVVATAFMLVVFGQIPINDVLVGRVAPAAWRSRAYAVRSALTFTVMASTLPLVGWIYGTRGFSALFAILSCAALVIFVAVLTLPKSAKFIKKPETVAI